MSHRPSPLTKVCAGLAAGVLALGLTACSGSSGGSTTTQQAPVTQSTITLPSSVQVVSAN
jgi:ABC-type glycerol-3-phosphate transport system substrate-binding protein